MDGVDYLIENVNRKLSLAKIGRGTKESIEKIDSAIEDLKELRQVINEKIR